MNDREKLVAAGVAVLIACLVSWYAVWMVLGRFEAKEQRLRKVESEVKQKKQEESKAFAAATRLKNYEERSLPPDTDSASSLYHAWLIEATSQSKLTDVKVTTQSPAMIRGTGSRLGFGLSAKGELDKIVDFLYRFQQMDWMHRIDTLKLVPQNESKQIEVSFNITALSLKSAPETETLAERTSESFKKDLAAYRDPILHRNFFGTPNREPKLDVASRTTATLGRSFDLSPKASDPDKFDKVRLEMLSSSEAAAKFDPASGKVSWTPKSKGEATFEFVARDDGWPSKASLPKKVVVTVVDPPPPPKVEVKAEPPKKPAFDPARYTVLTAVIDRTGDSEIWLHVRSENAIRILQVNDKFEIGSVKGVVSEIGVDDVIVTVGGKARRLVVGDTLVAADSSE